MYRLLTRYDLFFYPFSVLGFGSFFSVGGTACDARELAYCVSTGVYVGIAFIYDVCTFVLFNVPH